MKSELKNPPVSVAMIAYNEELNIVNVLKEYERDVFRKLPKGSEFILYLDKPTDSTPEVAKKFAKKLKIRVIVGKSNLGYAKAMQAVFAYTKNTIVFYSDSSGKHTAKDFWELYPFIERYDIVSGDRTNRTDPFIRQVITELQRLLVVILFQVPQHDYNAGFKILKRQVVTEVVPTCQYTKQSFSTELLVRAFKKGFTVISRPVSFKARKDEKSGTNLHHLPEIIKLNTRGLFLLKLAVMKDEKVCLS